MKWFVFIMLAALLIATPALGSETACEQQARNFISLLNQGNFSKAAELFDQKMKQALPPDKLGQLWSGLLASTGEFKKTIQTRTKIQGLYQAVLARCVFEKQLIDIKIVFDLKNNIAGLFFLPVKKTAAGQPDYVIPGSFKEIEVKVGQGKWVLPGTLTLPKQGGPFPTVVLVHGSGPQDRDETIGPNKPFKDLARGLASRGIAVLGYDKRTRVYGAQSAENPADLTVRQETIEDAVAAVSLLQSKSSVKKDKIFLLGHSLGGMLMPRIAEVQKTAAGFILMAANARPLEDLILEQTLFQASLKPDLTAKDKEHLALIKKLVTKIKNLTNRETSQGMLLGAPPAYWLDLKAYNPVKAAKAIIRPVLIMQGGNDCQVNKDRDFGLWQKELSQMPNLEFRFYPKLNHLFMKVDGKSTGKEYQNPGNIDVQVIEDIAAWVMKH
ncbi:alpha/beta hydrolase [Dethiosulfatarculus sandiegensis]|uniref:Serine aminopeptidase S33 domain-containing protein n=1 Tax=Dethiosulfatarculus sandiegensis TaxID=1429043 RepID=A0A0D2J7M2_9BACT|nr:alpha/beta fold hydrolase [Dethiosulfatarculus sandiegensis]KIX11731.1 hypothetical protein X474_22900 [Dethiosulfatarculus sandiegensis]